VTGVKGRDRHDSWRPLTLPPCRLLPVLLAVEDEEANGDEEARPLQGLVDGIQAIVSLMVHPDKMEHLARSRIKDVHGSAVGVGRWRVLDRHGCGSGVRLRDWGADDAPPWERRKPSGSLFAPNDRGFVGSAIHGNAHLGGRKSMKLWSVSSGRLTDDDQAASFQQKGSLPNISWRNAKCGHHGVTRNSPQLQVERYADDNHLEISRQYLRLMRETKISCAHSTLIQTH
jgi:hypothetical protein